MLKDEKDDVWLGDSLNVLQAFPKAVRADLGGDLRRLQIGEMPLDSKPMRTVGRVSSSCGHTIATISFGQCTWPERALISWCCIALLRSRTTSKSDINIAKERLKAFDRK